MKISTSFRPSLRTRVRRALGLSIYQCLLRFRRYSNLTPFEQFVRDGYSRVLERGLILDRNSIVLDFGGYIGDVSWSLHAKWHPQLHVFEPVPQFIEVLRARFRDCPNVHVHPYAIGENNRQDTFGLGAAGTGAFQQGDRRVEVQFRSINSVIPCLPTNIDLAIINIEGGEYELIPCLHASGLLKKIRKVLVQFHAVGESPIEKRELCRRLLGEHHALDWNYDFIWESWSSRPPTL
jgi:FkbM family methyltransferase